MTPLVSESVLPPCSGQPSSLQQAQLMLKPGELCLNATPIAVVVFATRVERIESGMLLLDHPLNLLLAPGNLPLELLIFSCHRGLLSLQILGRLMC